MTRKVDCRARQLRRRPATRSDAHIRRQVQIAIVGDVVEISSGGEVIRAHPIRHDRSRENGAFANPGGRPHRSTPPNPRPTCNTATGAKTEHGFERRSIHEISALRREVRKSSGEPDLARRLEFLRWSSTRDGRRGSDRLLLRGERQHRDPQLPHYLDRGSQPPPRRWPVPSGAPGRVRRHCGVAASLAPCTSAARAWHRSD